jgi:hypothetical protein
MKRGEIFILVFGFLCFQFSYSQHNNRIYPPPKPFPYSHNVPVDSSDYVNPRIFHPVIGIGPGILTFYGDVADKRTLAPSLSRVGYNLSLLEYISRSIMLGARAMFGKVGANEHGPRYMNFESSIRMGGIHLTYNFDNFLPMKRRISPFVVTGFEYFEFLSKTDLFDASGNRYFYWSDGSIMNMAESDPNAANAIPLIRDYVYETDIRKMNDDIFGKYPERSFALPVGAGVNFHLFPRWDFKLGATMHFGFTDYIDGITPKNKGIGEGKPNKDKFLETYFTLTFDLFNPKHPSFESLLSDADFMALANEDSDGDGVMDMKDSCQGTPPGVTVDAKGCPPDSDKDGYPDYLDKEVNSPPGAFVDENGVAMNDSVIARKYAMWSDTAWVYVEYSDTIMLPIAKAGESSGKKHDATMVYRRELVILLGSYKEGIPPEEMSKLLSVPDVRNTRQSDSSTAYIAGSYGTMLDAEKRKKEMILAGFPNAKIMVLNRDGLLSEPTTDVSYEFRAGSKTPYSVDMKSVVFRVQIGAYSRKLSTAIFNNVGQIIEMKTEDGLYKYVSGSFTTIQDAMKERDELVKKGYKDAFVVAYKDNKRVSLSSVSGGIIKPGTEDLNEPKTPKSAINKNLVFFRVQVGAFMQEPPSELMQKLSKIPGLEKKKKSSGITQYVAGKFNNYEEAKKFRDDVISKYEIHDAFLVAFFKDEMISIQEAMELLK